MNHRQTISIALTLAAALQIIGCDRTKPDAALTVQPPARKAPAPVVPASAVVLINGVKQAVPAPVLVASDLGAIVSVDVSSEPPATSRPATTQAADTETTYHLLMNVPVASVDDLAGAGWSRVLNEFPETSAEGFFLNGGKEQLVPKDVRAEFSLDGQVLTVTFRGECFRRVNQEAERDEMETVDVEATFVAPVAAQ